MLNTLSRWNLWTWNIPPQCFFLVNFSSRNNMILHFISLLNLQRISYSITNCIHNSNMVAIISKRLFTLRVVMAVWFWINVKEVDYPNGYWHPGDWKSHTLSPTCRSRYFFHLHRLRSCAEKVSSTPLPHFIPLPVPIADSPGECCDERQSGRAYDISLCEFYLIFWFLFVGS